MGRWHINQFENPGARARARVCRKTRLAVRTGADMAGRRGLTHPLKGISQEADAFQAPCRANAVHLAFAPTTNSKQTGNNQKILRNNIYWREYIITPCRILWAALCLISRWQWQISIKIVTENIEWYKAISERCPRHCIPISLDANPLFVNKRPRRRCTDAPSTATRKLNT